MICGTAVCVVDNTQDSVVRNNVELLCICCSEHAQVRILVNEVPEGCVCVCVCVCVCERERERKRDKERERERQ